MRLAALTALTMVAFAANSLLNREAVGGGDISAPAFAAIRVLAGAVMLALLVAVRGGRLRARPNPAGVLGLTAYLVGFSAAYVAMDAGLGALILFGTVQVTMFAGALLTGEAVPARRWLGMAVAFSGLIWLLGGAGDGIGPSLAMVAAGIGWGLYSLWGRGADDPLAATARNFIWSVPLVALALAWSGVGEMEARGVVLAVVSGAITSGLGYALWYGVLPALGASRAALAQLTVPVIALAGGAALLGEPVTGGLILATLWVLAGVTLGLSAGRR